QPCLVHEITILLKGFAIRSNAEQARSRREDGFEGTAPQAAGGEIASIYFKILMLSGSARGGGVRAVHNPQGGGVQNTLDLGPRMHRPGSGRVELYVGPPVLQSLARLLDLLVGKGQVVVSVSIGGRQLESRQVGANCVFHATGLVENIAQVKVRQGIAGVQLNGASIVLLGGFVILAGVVQGAGSCVGGGGFWVGVRYSLLKRH